MYSVNIEHVGSPIYKQFKQNKQFHRTWQEVTCTVDSLYGTLFFTWSLVYFHEEYYSACESSCMMSSVALEELCKVKKQLPGQCNQGYHQLGSKFIIIQIGAVGHKPAREGLMKDAIALHCRKCRSQCFWSLNQYILASTSSSLNVPNSWKYNIELLESPFKKICKTKTPKYKKKRFWFHQCLQDKKKQFPDLHEHFKFTFDCPVASIISVLCSFALNSSYKQTDRKVLEKPSPYSHLPVYRVINYIQKPGDAVFLPQGVSAHPLS